MHYGSPNLSEDESGMATPPPPSLRRASFTDTLMPVLDFTATTPGEAITPLSDHLTAQLPDLELFQGPSSHNQPEPIDSFNFGDEATDDNDGFTQEDIDKFESMFPAVCQSREHRTFDLPSSRVSSIIITEREHGDKPASKTLLSADAEFADLQDQLRRRSAPFALLRRSTTAASLSADSGALTRTTSFASIASTSSTLKRKREVTKNTGRNHVPVPAPLSKAWPKSMKANFAITITPYPSARSAAVQDSARRRELQEEKEAEDKLAIFNLLLDFAKQLVVARVRIYAPVYSSKLTELHGNVNCKYSVFLQTKDELKTTANELFNVLRPFLASNRSDDPSASVDDPNLKEDIRHIEIRGVENSNDEKKRICKDDNQPLYWPIEIQDSLSSNVRDFLKAQQESFVSASDPAVINSRGGKKALDVIRTALEEEQLASQLLETQKNIWHRDNWRHAAQNWLNDWIEAMAEPDPVKREDKLRKRRQLLIYGDSNVGKTYFVRNFLFGDISTKCVWNFPCGGGQGAERFRYSGYKPHLHKAVFNDEFNANLNVDTWKLMVAGEPFPQDIKNREATTLRIQLPMVFICQERPEEFLSFVGVKQRLLIISAELFDALSEVVYGLFDEWIDELLDGRGPTNLRVSKDRIVRWAKEAMEELLE